MAKESSIAPKERINITYVPATNGAQEEVELPLKVMVVGDFSGKASDTSIEERDIINVDKDNFNSVLEGMSPTLTLSVPNKLDEKASEDDMLPVTLSFQNIRDFDPDAVGRQIPEVNKLLELREALVALKGPMGNVPAFRKKMQQLLEDPQAREALLKELDILADAPAEPSAS